MKGGKRDGRPGIGGAAAAAASAPADAVWESERFSARRNRLRGWSAPPVPILEDMSSVFVRAVQHVRGESAFRGERDDAVG